MRFARWYWRQNQRLWRAMSRILRPVMLEVFGLIAAACVTLPWLLDLSGFALVEAGVLGIVSGWGFGVALGERMGA